MNDNTELALTTTDTLLSINESNRFIGRKGGSSLMGTKIMLYSLLKIEDRNIHPVPIEQMERYARLASETKVDYTQGLVAEMSAPELRRVLNKKACGTFYSELKTLFGDAKGNPKSLRNQFAVMVPSKDSNISGYAEIITACHYDSDNGRMYIKFNNETQIREMLLDLQEEYTSIPLSVLDASSIYELRLSEIIYKHIEEVNNVNLAAGRPFPDEYTFSYTIGELQMLLGVLDVTTDEITKKQLQVNNPDYNKIASEFQSRNPVYLGDNRRFRVSAIEGAVRAINKKDNFFIAYDVIKDGNRGKISSITFKVRDKKRHFNQEIIDVEAVEEVITELNAEAIVRISSILDDMFSVADIKTIWEYAGEDINKIKNAYSLFKALNKPKDDFISWFKMTMNM